MSQQTMAVRRKGFPVGPPQTTAYGGTVARPPAIPMAAEYAYYFVILNAIFGLVTVPLIGAGMLAALAAWCLSRLGTQVTAIWSRIWLPTACAASFLFIQLLYHGESILSPYNRGFVTWALSLVVAQCLATRRGFLHRYAVASAVIGVLLLPYLNLTYEVAADYQRAGLDASVGLSNGNALAAWFGFCCVYAIVYSIETKRALTRVASLMIAIGCLFIVGLTVSRGALAGIGMATVVAVCRSVKNRVAPAVLLALCMSLGLWSGVFNRAIDYYGARKSEETGRFLTWPVVIDQFLASPLTGTGASNAEVFVATKNDWVTPHNGFLFLALTSGFIPLVFFIGYWWAAGKCAITKFKARTPDAAFVLPLIGYAFVTTLLTNQAFMYDWSVVSLSIAVAAGTTLPSVRWRHAATGRPRHRTVKDALRRHPDMVQY